MAEPPTEPARFGWCATHDHRACPGQFTSSQTRQHCRCGCPCHHTKDTQ